MHSSEMVQTYRDQGLLMVEDFFDLGQIDQIERELGRYIAEIDPVKSAGRIVYEPGCAGKIRNVFHLNQDDAYFAELGLSPRLTDLASDIFDDEAVLVAVELFAKLARVGSEVPYHQDNAYFNLIPDDALTVWLALADADERNGCVRYIPGTHKLGNLPHLASGVKGNSMRLTELPADVPPEVCGKVRRGGVLVHHCNTIHRSEPNLSDHDRPGLLFVYKAAKCQLDEQRVQNYRSAAGAVVG